MSLPHKMMHLAAFVFPPVSHNGGWRLAQATPEADMSYPEYVKIAQLAERGRFDTIFFQDSAAMPGSGAVAKGDRSGTFFRPVRLEPMSILPALAMETTHLGLIATGTTTYNHPYHIARKFLTIDHISGGRAGWNLVTSQAEDEAANFGLEQHVDHAARYERAFEFCDVVTGLWDSWEEDAFLRNRETGQYFDVEKVHAIQHVGKHFRVRGPLNLSRSPQGRPVIAQAGSSEPGKELAAKTAEIVFTAQTSLASAKAFYDDVKSRMAKYGRDPSEMKILPGFNFVLGRSEAEAREHHAALQESITDEAALRTVMRLSGGLDLTKYPLDGPLPELPPSNTARARQQIMIDLARREHLSILQLGRKFAEANGHHVFVGTGPQLADLMQHWFEAGAADGFTMIPPYLSYPFEQFVELVTPELQRRGIFRTEYDSNTLRGNLGIPAPANRFAAARGAAAAAE
jgi:N-acetyl-S-(2-succino)cysteine monooxygenase